MAVTDIKADLLMNVMTDYRANKGTTLTEK